MTQSLGMRGASVARRVRRTPRESGYILITLILFAALLAITAGAILPALIFQLKRDREEELIHRGTQYSRAIKRFVKKTGNYPVRLEQMDNTNLIRFLRKRYKDPITGKDFKLLHQGEVPTLSAGLALSGTGGVGGLAAGQQGQQQLAGLAAQAIAAQTGQASGVQGATSPGSSLFGDQQNGTQASGLTQTPTGSGTTAGNSVEGQAPGTPSDQSGQAVTATAPIGSSSTSTSGPQGGGQVFGSAGPIVGVTSISKDKTIRVFAKKDHYNQWQFVYDPSTDRGGLISTPYQPLIDSDAPNVNGKPASGTTGINSGTGNPAGTIQGNNPGNGPVQQPAVPNDTPLQP